MRYQEINEHQLSKMPAGFTWLTAGTRDLILQGNKEPMPLKMLYGEFDLWRNDNLFGVVFDDALLAVAQIDHYKDGIYFLRRLETSKTHQTQDMAAAIFHYLCCDLRMELLSDDTMSPQGEAFWHKMMTRNQIGIGIWDIDTDEWYPISSINQLTRNGSEFVLDPHDDTGRYDIDMNRNRRYRPTLHYRFYWIVTGGESHYLAEMIARGKDREMMMFGGQDYPDYQR